MKLYNLKDHNEQVSFAQAIKQGLGKQQGLFFPLELPEFELTEIDKLLDLDFVTRSSRILSAFIGSEIAPDVLTKRVQAALNSQPLLHKLKMISPFWSCSTARPWRLKTLAHVLWHRCWPKLLAINPSLF